MWSVTGWPGRIASSWVSLKFAATQMSSGTNIVRFVPGCAYSTDRGGELDDPARLGCRDSRIGKVQLRLVALRFGLRQVRHGAVALRLQRLDLPLRQFERRLRTVERGLLLMQLRGILLGVLNGTRDRVREVFVARRLLLREHQRRLRLLDLCLGRR